MAAYISLPGTSGHYLSTADVNLFDADTAHLHQSRGKWVSANAVSGIGVASTITPIIGDQHGVGSVTAGTSRWIYSASQFTGVDGAPVTAGQTYTALISLAIEKAQVATDPYIRILWADASHTALTPSASTPVTLPVGAFGASPFAVTAVAPTGAVWAYIHVNFGTIDTASKVWWDGAMIAQGSYTEFVPSLRIVGDLDIEAKLAADDYTPTADITIVDCLNSNDGYRLAITTGDLIELSYGNGSSDRTQTSTATGLSDGTAHVIRATVDVSTGAVVYYIDGVQHDTDTMTTGAGTVTDITDLYVGATSADAELFDGDVYYVEVRDGIDGPVVARMDADDWVGI